MTSVVVVEDHPVFRDGLVAACERADGVTVIAAVGTVREAHVALAAEPDVLLLDLGLPDGSGLDVLAALRARRSRTAALVLTMNDDAESVLEAVRAGARGYVLKGSGQQEITEAIRRVAAGHVVLDGAAGDVVLGAAASNELGPAQRWGLTDRENDVLRLLAGGLDNTGIAARLGLSPKTVRNQVSLVLAKLAVESRSAAAELARRHGVG